MRDREQRVHRDEAAGDGSLEAGPSHSRRPRNRRTRHRTSPGALRVVTVDDDDFCKVDKHLAAVSWAFGAPGSQVPSSTVTSGEARRPRDRFVSRPWPSLVEGFGPKTQSLVAVEMAGPTDGEHQTPDLRSRFSQELMNSTAGKACLLMLAAWHPDGDPVQVRLGDLAEEFYPATNKLRPHHLSSTAKALTCARALHLVVRQDFALPLFRVTTAAFSEHLDADLTFSWALAPGFREYLRTPPPALRGSFLVNLDALMRLDGRDGGQLRAYLRCADLWNRARVPGGKDRGEFEPARLAWFSVRDWAALVNSLSRRSVDFLQHASPASARGDLARDLRAAENDLAALAEQHGVLRVEQSGMRGKRRLRMLPPEDVLEAWRLFRRGRGRSR